MLISLLFFLCYIIVSTPTSEVPVDYDNSNQYADSVHDEREQ